MGPWPKLCVYLVERARPDALWQALPPGKAFPGIVSLANAEKS
jgi:hypothetical protein